MGKKLTAFTFVLIATLSVLAHAVIPHHHHQVIVCVQDIQQEERACSHKEGVHEQDKDEHHEGHSHATPCEFRLAIVVPSSQGKQLRSCDDCSDSHQHNLYLLTASVRVELPPQQVAPTNNPDFSSFHTSFVASTLGLRAPPLV